MKTELKVCETCMLAENGVGDPDALDSHKCMEAWNRLYAEYGTRRVHCNDVEEVFSWTPCDCCGSRLGGPRFGYTVCR